MSDRLLIKACLDDVHAQLREIAVAFLREGLEIARRRATISGDECPAIDWEDAERAVEGRAHEILGTWSD